MLLNHEARHVNLSRESLSNNGLILYNASSFRPKSRLIRLVLTRLEFSCSAHPFPITHRSILPNCQRTYQMQKIEHYKSEIRNIGKAGVERSLERKFYSISNSF